MNLYCGDVTQLEECSAVYRVVAGSSPVILANILTARSSAGRALGRWFESSRAEYDSTKGRE